MRKLKTLAVIIGSLVILFAVLGARPTAALALPEGITPTPTEPGPEATATPTNPPPTEVPTATPTSPISPPVGGTETPVPTVTSTPVTPEEPAPKAPKATKTPEVLLPTTGDSIPPDSPFGGPTMLAILAAGILIGTFIGLGSRRFLASRFGRWISLFLSSGR